MTANPELCLIVVPVCTALGQSGVKTRPFSPTLPVMDNLALFLMASEKVSWVAWKGNRKNAECYNISVFSAKYDNNFGITFIRDSFPKHGYPGVLRRPFGLGSSAESSGGFPTFRSQSGLQKGGQATSCTQQSGQETKSCLHLPSRRQTDGTSRHAELLFLEVSKEKNWICISSSGTISYPSPYIPN